MVERAPDEVFAGVDRQLVEHLVGSHHGRARPLFPPIADSFEPDVAADFDGVTFTAPVADAHPAWSQPQRYARLCDRYGAWGLAYLEALVRLADISISKEGR
jgi:CRISPR-associated endonuclease/helicase Cas3